jgi:glycerophosphoryl diester phosphodiesterase
VIDVLRQGRGRYAVHSFDHAAVKRARAADPELRTGVLLSSYVIDPVAVMHAAGATDYWQSADLVDADLVERIHEAHGRVTAWTVNAPDDMARLTGMGVDGICTDDVRIARRMAAAP